MKTLKSIVVLVMAAATAVSCVESSDKYKNLLAERDALQNKTQIIEQNYNETLDVLNDVEAGFAAIRQSESAILAKMSNTEIKGDTKKQQISQQLALVKGILEENRKRIASLEGQLGGSNAKIAQTIKLMEQEIKMRETAIAELQAELSKRNIRIVELTANVDSLSKNVASLNDNVKILNEESESQKSVITAQDADLNTVWYITGTAKELKNSNVTQSGLFQAKRVLESNFDNTKFTKVDLRQLKSIDFDVRKVKLLTSHPAGSYQFKTIGNTKNVQLLITEPAKFWSISRYLVIEKQ